MPCRSDSDAARAAGSSRRQPPRGRRRRALERPRARRRRRRRHRGGSASGPAVPHQGDPLRHARSRARHVETIDAPRGRGDRGRRTGAAARAGRRVRDRHRAASAPTMLDLVQAVERTGAAEIVVLPVAQTFRGLDCRGRHVRYVPAGVRVAVVPTTEPVQALAALAVHDADRAFDDDVIAMTAAAARRGRGRWSSRSSVRSRTPAWSRSAR